MGLWADGQTLWLSSRYQIWRFENVLRGGELYQGYDTLYVPRTGHTTGDLDVHDLAVTADGRVIFAATSFGCLATLSKRHSFAPLWRPPFLSKLTAEDRCHLNGLALGTGRPKYVTVVGMCDIIDGWRDRRRDGGADSGGARRAGGRPRPVDAPFAAALPRPLVGVGLRPGPARQHRGGFRLLCSPGVLSRISARPGVLGRLCDRRPVGTARGQDVCRPGADERWSGGAGPAVDCKSSTCAAAIRSTGCGLKGWSASCTTWPFCPASHGPRCWGSRNDEIQQLISIGEEEPL